MDFRDAWFGVPFELYLDLLSVRVMEGKVLVIIITGDEVKSSLRVFLGVEDLFLDEISHVSFN